MNYIWKPFKSFFINTTCIYGGIQYGRALEMQDYYPADYVATNLTKTQSFFLWVANWDIFYYFNNLIASLSWLIGISKIWIIILIWLFIVYIFYKIFILIKKLLLPKKQILQKQGLDLLKEIAEFDNKKEDFKELQNKLKDYENKLKDISEKNKEIKKQNKHLTDINTKFLIKLQNKLALNIKDFSEEEKKILEDINPNFIKQQKDK